MTHPNEATASECGFVPYPGSGAYGHWACERRRWHLGPHRFINYTVPRIPHVWRVKLLFGHWRMVRRLRSYHLGKPRVAGYGRVLYPSTYAPVPPAAVPVGLSGTNEETT